MTAGSILKIYARALKAVYNMIMQSVALSVVALLASAAGILVIAIMAPIALAGVIALLLDKHVFQPIRKKYASR